MDKTPQAEQWPKDASVHLQVAASCKAKGAKACDIHGIDLSESSQVRKFADDVLAKHKTVDVLVNNAGMGTSSGSGPIKGELTVTQVLFIYDGLLMTQMAGLHRLTKCVAAQCVSVDKPLILLHLLDSCLCWASPNLHLHATMRHVILVLCCCRL